MKEKCPNCPCPDICMAKPTWCEWMAAPNPHPTQIKGICDRSRIGIGQQAYNVAGAIGRVAVAALTRHKVLVDEKTLAARRATCQGCDHLKGPKCELCGCYYQVKITLTTESCPISKWKRIES
jgi:Family of unknown function (DUF6171)